MERERTNREERLEALGHMVQQLIDGVKEEREGNTADDDEKEEEVTSEALHELSEILSDTARMIRAIGEKTYSMEQDLRYQEFVIQNGLMFLVATPGEDYELVSEEDLEDKFPEAFDDKSDELKLIPIPETENLYWLPTVTCGKKHKKKGNQVKDPVIAMAFREDTGEVRNMTAKELYQTILFFENATVHMITKEGSKTTFFLKGDA